MALVSSNVFESCFFCRGLTLEKYLEKYWDDKKDKSFGEKKKQKRVFAGFLFDAMETNQLSEFQAKVKTQTQVNQGKLQTLWYL